MVYENCKFYGPYSNSKDGRLRCIVVFPDNTKKTISYPKYLMEVHLDRYLAENETIDHIDGNFLNNDLSNLQVIDRQKHSYNDVYRNEDITVKCQYCGKEFIIKGSTIRQRNRTDRHQSGYFCSKQCSGKYGRDIQRGIIEHDTVDRVTPSKYQVKSAKDENL
jgi:hypothetical protein